MKMINRSRFRVVTNRFLNEETYNLIQNGYFAINKRPKLTSAEELEEIKNAIVFGMEVDEAVKNEKYLLRAGHGGILDSMATGVLAVGLCNGCKVMNALCASDKRYTVTGQLGVATDTYNSKGKVVAEAGYNHVTKRRLEEAVKDFEGEIWQTPPPFSSLKIGGVRSSDLVRSGEDVKLAPRPVVCHFVRCVGFEPPYFTLDVSCGSGFYVRSLVQDLAEALGSCGHVTALVRTKHGPFTLQDCLQPDQYSRENIITAVQEAHRKYPELFKLIIDYFRVQKQKRIPSSFKKKHKESEEVVQSGDKSHSSQKDKDSCLRHV